MSDMRTCFKRVDYDLAGLLHYIDIGDIGLPDIQRPFVWSATKVRELFDSMYRGFPVRNRIEGFIQRHTDRITEQAFRQLHAQGDLCFFLESREGRFEIPSKVSVRYTRKLRHDNDDDIQKSLFDYVPDDDLNYYEKSIALYLDRDPQVLWWYRNLVGSSNFSIQGYRRNRIYPDFVVQKGNAEQEVPTATVLVVESKGQHLKGSEDTTYKRAVAGFFENVGQEVKWQDLGQNFEKNTFRVQVLDEGEYADKDWRIDLKKILEM